MINKKYVCGDRLTKSRTLLITIKSINGDLYFSVQCLTVEGLKQNDQLWTVLLTLAEHPTAPPPPPTIGRLQTIVFPFHASQQILTSDWQVLQLL